MGAGTTLLLLSLRLAQATEQPPESPAPPPVAAPEDMTKEVERLRAELASGQADSAELAAARALLDAASALVDPRSGEETKVEAARALGARSDPRAWPFLASAVRDLSVPVRVAALDALAAFSTEDTVNLATGVLQDDRQADETRQAALRVLGAMELQSAGDSLYAFAADISEDSGLREAALEILRARWPELLAARGEPRATEKRSGPESILGVSANALAGGILLSSVGVLGKSDAGVVIGAVGGGLIGTGTGLTYALTRPVTLSQNMQYAAGVGWGLELGVMANNAIYGGEYPPTREPVGAALRAAGVGLGAGLAYSRFKKDIDPIDIVELNTSVWIGQQLGLGIAGVATDPGYGYDFAWGIGHRPRMSAGLAGAALGAGVGMLARERWDLDRDDAIFTGVTFASAAWTGAWLPTAFSSRGYMGVPRLVANGLGAGALLFSELYPVSPKRSFTMGYGVVAGNAIGAGIPRLAQVEGSQPAVAAMLASGVLGGAVGFAVGEHLHPKPGDYALVGIGVPIIVAESAAIGSVLTNRGQLDWRQYPGLILTAGGVGAAGLLAGGYAFDPQPGQVVLVGTAAGWGAWYGALTPIALDLPGDRDDLLLTIVGTADAFMLGAVVMELPAVQLDPRRTLVPQLGGVGGATLGALAVGLATSDRQAIAGGAVVGSVVGIGGGMVVEGVLEKRRAPEALRLPHPHIDLPGVWAVSGAPMPSDDGMGLQVNLSVLGW